MKRYSSNDGIPTLEMALSEFMNADDLKKLVTLTKEKLPTRKADLAAVIMRHLDGESLHTLWHGLDELQRAAVAEVVHSSSTKFPTDRFYAKYGCGPNWGSTDKWGCRQTPSALGFFFYGNGVMPDDLKARLQTFVPPPVKTTIQTLAELPAVYVRPTSHWNRETKMYEKGIEELPFTVRESERPAQRELLSVLRLIDSGKVSVSDKTRRASAATVETITGILEGDDYYPQLPVTNKWHEENVGPIRAFAWPLLVQAGALAQLSGSKLQLTKAGRKALSEPAAETLRTLWPKWIDTNIIDELSRIECIKGQTGKGKRGLITVSWRRDAIATSLSECPAGVWISTDEFFRFLRASGIEFSVTHNAWNLYIGELQYGSLGYENGDHILEERYLFAFLLEYAATLGLLDVALIPPAGARPNYGSLWGTDDLVYFSRYDGLMYIRITPLGAYCLGIESTYQAAPIAVRAVLHVLPNLEVAAIGAQLDQGDRLALDAYATKISDFVWRLDAGKLLAAVEEGHPVDELREFLMARSAAAIPGTVSRLLDDVSDRIAKILDRGLARLVECADPALAALIANDSRTRKHCLRAGEQHLVVPKSSETAFKRNLREVGYLVGMGEDTIVRTRSRTPSAKSTSQLSET